MIHFYCKNCWSDGMASCNRRPPMLLLKSVVWDPSPLECHLFAPFLPHLRCLRQYSVRRCALSKALALPASREDQKRKSMFVDRLRQEISRFDSLVMILLLTSALKMPKCFLHGARLSQSTTSPFFELHMGNIQTWVSLRRLATRSSHIFLGCKARKPRNDPLATCFRCRICGLLVEKLGDIFDHHRSAHARPLAMGIYGDVMYEPQRLFRAKSKLQASTTLHREPKSAWEACLAICVNGPAGADCSKTDSQLYAFDCLLDWLAVAALECRSSAVFN